MLDFLLTSKTFLIGDNMNDVTKVKQVPNPVLKLKWKVFTVGNECVGAFKVRQDAGAFLGLAHMNGATVRYGKRTLWVEGQEDFNAASDVEAFADIVGARLLDD